MTFDFASYLKLKAAYEANRSNVITISDFGTVFSKQRSTYIGISNCL